MAPQIGFPGLAPRSRAHLCFTMVEGSNRRREEGDVSRDFGFLERLIGRARLVSSLQVHSQFGEERTSLQL